MMILLINTVQNLANQHFTGQCTDNYSGGRGICGKCAPRNGAENITHFRLLSIIVQTIILRANRYADQYNIRISSFHSPVNTWKSGAGAVILT